MDPVVSHSPFIQRDSNAIANILPKPITEIGLKQTKIKYYIPYSLIRWTKTSRTMKGPQGS